MHPHDEERYRLNQRATLVGAISNTGLALIKIILGLLGRSPALFADGLHSLSDLLCDGLVLVATYYGKADADANHPYGHKRIETIATFGLGLILFFIGLSVCGDGAFRILHSTHQKPNFYTLWIALISVIVNEVVFRYQRNVARHIGSDLLHANAAHRRSDTLSSLVVVIGIAGALAGWPFLDTLAAMFVGLLIITAGIRWAWSALYELSDAGIDSKTLYEIQKSIEQTGGVLHMHQLRTRKMAEKIILDVHIEIPLYSSASEGHYISECVRVKLMKSHPNISDVTVHVDTENHPEGIPPKLPLSRADLLNQLMPLWTKTISESAIHQMTLHYIGGGIEIELQLLKTQTQASPEELHAAFENSIRSVTGIRRITLLMLI